MGYWVFDCKKNVTDMAVFGRNSVTDEKHAQPVVYGQMFLCVFPAMSIYIILHVLNISVSFDCADTCMYLPHLGFAMSLM